MAYLLAGYASDQSDTKPAKPEPAKSPKSKKRRGNYDPLAADFTGPWKQARVERSQAAESPAAEKAGATKAAETLLTTTFQFTFYAEWLQESIQAASLAAGAGDSVFTTGGHVAFSTSEPVLKMVAFPSMRHLVLAIAGRTGYLLDAASGEVVVRYEATAKMKDATFAMAGNLVVFLLEDGSVWVVETASGRAQQVWKSAKANLVLGVGGHLVVAADSKLVELRKFHEFPTTSVQAVEYHGHQGQIHCMTPLETSRERLVTAASDGKLIVWQVGNQHPVHELLANLLVNAMLVHVFPERLSVPVAKDAYAVPPFVEGVLFCLTDTGVVPFSIGHWLKEIMGPTGGPVKVLSVLKRVQRGVALAGHFIPGELPLPGKFGGFRFQADWSGRTIVSGTAQGGVIFLDWTSTGLEVRKEAEIPAAHSPEVCNSVVKTSWGLVTAGWDGRLRFWRRNPL